SGPSGRQTRRARLLVCERHPRVPLELEVWRDVLARTRRAVCQAAEGRRGRRRGVEEALTGGALASGGGAWTRERPLAATVARRRGRAVVLGPLACRMMVLGLLGLLALRVVQARAGEASTLLPHLALDSANEARVGDRLPSKSLHYTCKPMAMPTTRPAGTWGARRSACRTTCKSSARHWPRRPACVPAQAQAGGANELHDADGLVHGCLLSGRGFQLLLVDEHLPLLLSSYLPVALGCLRRVAPPTRPILPVEDTCLSRRESPFSPAFKPWGVLAHVV